MFIGKKQKKGWDYEFKKCIILSLVWWVYDEKED